MVFPYLHIITEEKCEVLDNLRRKYVKLLILDKKIYRVYWKSLNAVISMSRVFYFDNIPST